MRRRSATRRPTPGYDFGVFLKIGLPPEWERQAFAAKKK